MDAGLHLTSPPERVIFTEEGGPGQQLKVLVSGEFDLSLLEALANFVTRQKRRLGREKRP